ncbi:myrosinase 1-like [Anthonomus grandis grandis]|uniref:myrosinase 1-like n=1 Tax=Anthonomus grandis grandis TaxID=2921223 RepID=UPI002166AAB8|nr:myrosinase 1-like [Anthonomus grandis grandis]
MKTSRAILLSFQVILGYSVGCLGHNDYEFPKSFDFGAVTASFAIEGGWNADGKGESVWDFITHEIPEIVEAESGANYNITKAAEVAADSYHRFEEDIKAAKEIGLNFYRFSISWTRILPHGFNFHVNQAGIDYYNKLIDAIIAANVTPVATLLHYDSPAVGDPFLGGFSNELAVQCFVDYADLVFGLFGDRIRYWITFNAPSKLCNEFPRKILAKNSKYFPTGIYEYTCAHNVIKAHAKTYRLYESKYKTSQKGLLSISLELTWHEPASNSKEDIEAASRAMDFTFGWFAHPLIHGNYPKSMIHTIGELSKKQNFTSSRLSKFTPEEIINIKGTLDYFCVGPMQTYLTSANKEIPKIPSTNTDGQYSVQVNKSWIDPNNFYTNTPWGFRKALNYVWNSYGHKQISITEHGYAALDDSLNDSYRIDFMKKYLEQVLLLIHEDKVDIGSYSVLSLIDIFYFEYALKIKFGLVQVDFNNNEFPRTPKNSAKYYTQVIKNRKL